MLQHNVDGTVLSFQLSIMNSRLPLTNSTTIKLLKNIIMHFETNKLNLDVPPLDKVKKRKGYTTTRASSTSSPEKNILS